MFEISTAEMKFVMNNGMFRTYAIETTIEKKIYLKDSELNTWAVNLLIERRKMKQEQIRNHA